MHNNISTTDDVTATLRRYLDDLKSQNIWRSVWPLAERLLSRKNEMQSVWEDIACKELSWEQCYTLWEQIVLAGKFGSQENISRLKADHNQLKVLNQDIRKKAAELAAMLTEREAILNTNSFLQDHTTHIVELMEKADDDKGLYRDNLHEKLDTLASQYDIKHWPTLPGLLQVVADESVDIAFRHENDLDIIHGRSKILPDYLRKLFSRIENVRGYRWGLPKEFTLTDKTLATLADVTLEHTEAFNVDAVKVRRNEFKKNGTRGAW
ncbi:hypothetical protein ACLEDY_00595 [Lonsdalea quercina]|uniref:hypothetical protein n=1 Tax=Lonsdalea quercina TaxID=71657 RepID=UPI0039769237